jgi:hypothetical protein
MSFFAPLYIAGLLAVSLPIVFHLLRRKPRGQVLFSSLMFLSPSPPRVTKRSRLDNILLLVLRGLALALLAFAFARPFWREASSMEISDRPIRRVTILLDRSASMRRGDLWPQAVAQCEQALAAMTPADQVALVSFDDGVETVVSFDNWNQAPAPQRAALVRGKLKELAPSWGATELGRAIGAAADLLADASDATQAAADAARQIILITDLSEGSRLEALQAFAWPQGVTLDARIVRPSTASNAGLHLAGDGDELDPTAADNRLRVRVSNEADSRQERFTLHWANSAGEIASLEPQNVHVPAGADRVVRVSRPGSAAASTASADSTSMTGAPASMTGAPASMTGAPASMTGASADRLILAGDDYDFDNTLYLATPRQEEVTVAYFGADDDDDIQGLRYYLERALVDTPRRKVRLAVVPPDGNLEPADALAMRLAIVTDAVSADQATRLRDFVAGGGAVLVALPDSDATTLRKLLKAPDLKVEEATGGDFALFGEISYSHPLFAPFADPRFGDFTKIHFWKHRRLQIPDGAGLHVLAQFDNGDPAVVEQVAGAGATIVWTSTWRPSDSQLALSSKFVPLLGALLNRRGQGESERTQFTVGDALPTNYESAAPNRPGIYESAGRRFAVNLAADESRTAPLAVEELEQRGAKLGSEGRRKADVERRRQLQVAELENRQKLWRWLIVGVLGLVFAETAVAGVVNKRSPR